MPRKNRLQLTADESAARCIGTAMDGSFTEYSCFAFDLAICLTTSGHLPTWRSRLKDVPTDRWTARHLSRLGSLFFSDGAAPMITLAWEIDKRAVGAVNCWGCPAAFVPGFFNLSLARPCVSA